MAFDKVVCTASSVAHQWPQEFQKTVKEASYELQKRNHKREVSQTEGLSKKRSSHCQPQPSFASLVSLRAATSMLYLCRKLTEAKHIARRRG